MCWSHISVTSTSWYHISTEVKSILGLLRMSSLYIYIVTISIMDIIRYICIISVIYIDNFRY